MQHMQIMVAAEIIHGNYSSFETSAMTVQQMTVQQRKQA